MVHGGSSLDGEIELEAWLSVHKLLLVSIQLASSLLGSSLCPVSTVLLTFSKSGVTVGQSGVDEAAGRFFNHGFVFGGEAGRRCSRCGALGFFFV
jgi:hypothetical protein